jgi:hypothetical protein
MRNSLQMNNPVAKYCNEYNKPATHKDRKKEKANGYVKHKGNYYEAER